MSDSTDTLDVTIMTENEEVTAAEYVQLRKDAHCSIEAHLRLKNVLEDFEARSESSGRPAQIDNAWISSV